MAESHNTGSNGLRPSDSEQPPPLASGWATAAPSSRTWSGSARPSLYTESMAVVVPVAAGVNCTLIVQTAPAASSNGTAAQPPPAASKPAPTTTCVTRIVAAVLLRSTSSWGAEWLPCCTPLNSSNVADASRGAAGTGAPVPCRLSVAGFVPLETTCTVACRRPGAVGEKVARMSQYSLS